MPTTAKPPNPIVALSGISATAASKLANTLDFGMAPSAQFDAFLAAVEKDVGAQEHRQHQRPVGRAGDVAVAFRPPYVVAGGDLALVVDQTAFEHEGLLDLDMLVQAQLGPGLPAEQRGEEAGVAVLEQDFTSGTRPCRWSGCRTVCRPRRPGRAASGG